MISVSTRIFAAPGPLAAQSRSTNANSRGSADRSSVTAGWAADRIVKIGLTRKTLRIGPAMQKAMYASGSTKIRRTAAANASLVKCDQTP